VRGFSQIDTSKLLTPGGVSTGPAPTRILTPEEASMLAQGVPAYCFGPQTSAGQALTCAILMAGTREGQEKLRVQADLRARVAQAQRDILQSFMTTDVDSVIGRRLLEISREGRWVSLKNGNKKCLFNGSAVYDIPCAAEALLAKIWIRGDYEACRPWLSQGTMVRPAVRDRARWYSKITQFISNAHVSLGIQAPFIHDRVEARDTGSVGNRRLLVPRTTRSGRPVYALPPARETTKTNRLMTYGPSGARAMLVRWWKASRRQGRRLYVPISHSSMFSIQSGFPAPILESGEVAQPWSLMENGLYRSDCTQAPSRIVAASQHCDANSASGRGEYDWAGIANLTTLFQDAKRQPLTNRAEVFTRVAARTDPGELVPMEVLFPELRLASEFMVPTWTALQAYMTEWTKPIVELSFDEMLARSWDRYIEYFRTFPPEAVGMTPAQFEAVLAEMQNARNAVLSGFLTTAGGVALALGGVAGVVVGAVLLILALLNMLVPADPRCPRMPIPFMFRTPASSDCSMGVSHERTAMDAAVATVENAARIGVTLQPPPGAPMTDGRGRDLQVDAGSGKNAPLIVGGLIAAAAAMAFVARGG
jgi:hypothetical protein